MNRTEVNQNPLIYSIFQFSEGFSFFFPNASLVSGSQFLTFVPVHPRRRWCHPWYRHHGFRTLAVSLPSYSDTSAYNEIALHHHHVHYSIVLWMVWLWSSSVTSSLTYILSAGECKQSYSLTVRVRPLCSSRHWQPRYTNLQEEQLVSHSVTCNYTWWSYVVVFCHDLHIIGLSWRV